MMPFYDIRLKQNCPLMSICTSLYVIVHVRYCHSRIEFSVRLICHFYIRRERKFISIFICQKIQILNRVRVKFVYGIFVNIRVSPCLHFGAVNYRITCATPGNLARKSHAAISRPRASFAISVAN